MHFTRLILLALLSWALVCLPAAAEQSATKPRLNVLFLIADDLANTLGCYQFPQAQTPAIDQLAAKGVLFERAYCQFPHCNPSRSSILSGWRPDVTRVTNNEDNLYVNHPGVVTLPRHFRDHGYATARCGKIFHLGVPSGAESMDDPLAWDFGLPFRNEQPYPPQRKSTVNVKVSKGQGLAWNESTGADDDLVDGQFAARAIRWLEERDTNKPFFLAVGFHRPHLPLVAPANYFDRFDYNAIQLPLAPADDEADIPLPARNGGVTGYTLQTTPEQRRAAIRAYLACVNYVDAQVARLLATLERLKLSDNTIVIFTSDHGWHLGEHGLWHKRSLFEESARVPLIVYLPGATGNTRRAAGLVESLDLFPTLCDLTGLPTPASAQGKTLRPMLADPTQKIHDAAFTQARRGPGQANWGRSVRTERWRYTDWDEGRSGVELYDHDTDPHEYTNLAERPDHAETLAKLRALLTNVRGKP